MDPVFIWIEESPLSRWVTGDGFQGVLVLHTLGVALVAGPSIAVALAVLGAAPRLPPPALRGFLPVVWLGMAAAAASGALLLVGYPTKALTNPVFYAKLAAIGLGVGLLLRTRARVLSGSVGAQLPSGRAMAWASLFLWVGALTAGRLLAYTYTRLTAAW